MGKMIDIISNFVETFIGFFDMISRYFIIQFNALEYMYGSILALPTYLKAFIFALIGVSVVLMILNRGA